MLTNIGLVELVKKAYKEGWGYVNGTYGNILTESLLNAKCTQAGGVGAYNSQWRDKYIKKFMGKRVSDCYGLIKAYVWWTAEGKSPKYNANGCIDRNQEGAYRAATKKGPLSTMPDIPGIVLWMTGHVGVYIGNGEFIECAGCPIGMFKGKIQNGKIVSGSKFTNWFMDNWLIYEEKTFTKESAADFIQKAAGLEEKTIDYLNAYRYDNALLVKLAQAIYNKPKANNYNGVVVNSVMACNIVKSSAGLEQKTIEYLKDDYKYGENLIVKLAKAMI